MFTAHFGFELPALPVYPHPALTDGKNWRGPSHSRFMARRGQSVSSLEVVTDLRKPVLLYVTV